MERSNKKLFGKTCRILIISFTLQCSTVTRAAVSTACRYTKHSQTINETCLEEVFMETTSSLLQCANKCTVVMGCFSFYYSSVLQSCLGCPLRFTVLNSAEKNYSYYTPVEGQKDNMCGYFKYNSHYYTLNTDPLKADEASNKCSNAGGHLVYVETEEEHEFLENKSVMIPGLPNKKFWIGAFLNTSTEDGKWRWGNGVKTEDTFNNSFQPSGNGRCVIMGYGKGVWDDQSCSNRNQFICEIQ